MFIRNPDIYADPKNSPPIERQWKYPGRNTNGAHVFFRVFFTFPAAIGLSQHNITLHGEVADS